MPRNGILISASNSSTLSIFGVENNDIFSSSFNSLLKIGSKNLVKSVFKAFL